MFANPKILLAIELNLVGRTYAERCKTRLYWPVSIGVTACQHPQLVNERESFEVHGEDRAGAEKTENKCAGMFTHNFRLSNARTLCLNWCFCLMICDVVIG